MILGRLLLLGFFALALPASLTGCAERLAYWPSRAAFETPHAAEDIWFETSDGVLLHGWFLPAKGVPEGEPAPAVLHLHGNTGNISTHTQFSEFLTEHGIHVMMFDYRSYGRSARGGLQRDNLLRDANAALDTLLARPDVDPDRVGAYGVSLGGAFGIALAADREEVSALVTLVTFSTWKGVASDWVPLLGPSLVQDGWDPVDRLPDLAGRPYLIVHGTNDRIIHVRHSEILMQRATAEQLDAELLIATDATHNAILESNPEAKQGIAAFFTKHLGEIR
jgi:dipeptidyl aminopeptidase/acylaminoacyl peptidase